MYLNLTLNEFLEKTKKTNIYLCLNNAKFQLYENNFNGGLCHWINTINGKKILVECEGCNCPLCLKDFKSTCRATVTVFDLNDNTPKYADFPISILQQIEAYINNPEYDLHKTIFKIIKNGDGKNCSYKVITLREERQLNEKEIDLLQSFIKNHPIKQFYKYDNVRDKIKDV